MGEPDWADKRAAAFLTRKHPAKTRADIWITSLAALLRENQQNVLAEVRRVVEVYAWPQACRDEILRRLEKL
jgi:hypothetical protein